MSVLSKPYFHDEEKAFAFLETVLWPDGPICPKCGGEGYPLEGVRNKAKKDKAGNVIAEGKVRVGLKKCRACRAQFTVRVGTVFESSHVELHRWLQAVHLICSSKKGFSAHQLHRVLEVQYKTAWFMAHRIREAMRSGALAPFGFGGGTVEVDETFIGRDKTKKVKVGYQHKYKILALVDRDSGASRAMVIDNVDMKTIAPIMRENIAREARIMTDEANHYRHTARWFAAHEQVQHSAKEYVRKGEPDVHTNTIEGYFSIFKRGMRGTYQHCGKQHLHRYLAEFDFRYTHRSACGIEDQQRTELALRGIVGKRLLYRDSSMW
jgi:hypothetical protein